MFVKTFLGIIVGAGIGFLIGSFLQRHGGTCPLTCNPWGAMIYGAMFGLLLTMP